MAVPQLEYGDAEALGEELALRWELITDRPLPMLPHDLRWADLVQFVLRRAGEIDAARGDGEGAAA